MCHFDCSGDMCHFECDMKLKDICSVNDDTLKICCYMVDIILNMVKTCVFDTSLIW